MHGVEYANYAVNDADLLIACGVRFDDRVTGKLDEFAKHGKIVHVDIDPSEIHKNRRAHIPVDGDVEQFAAGARPQIARGADDGLPPSRTRVARQIDDWQPTDPFRTATSDAHHAAVRDRRAARTSARGRDAI